MKKIDLSETMKMFYNLNEKDLVPGIEEVVQEKKTPTLYPEDQLPVHVIHDDG